MSVVMEPGFCYCSCHEPGSHALHGFPCCDGRCHLCRRFVSRGRMEEHLEQHAERMRELLNAAPRDPDDCC